MRTYERDLAAYRSYRADPRFREPPPLAPAQLERARELAAGWAAFELRRPWLHAMLSLLPLLLLAPAMAWALLELPSVLLARGWPAWAAAPVIGFAFGALAYQWTLYALHEGAAHGAILRNAPRALAWLKPAASQAARLFRADPVYYSEAHLRHHQHLGRERDGSFTHFVDLGRLLRAMAPGAGVLFANDFQAHHPERTSPSRKLSSRLALAMLALSVGALSRSLPFGWALLAVVVVAPWTGATLDRLRETHEHALMPDERLTGSRELGLSPVRLLVGGGPWGQLFHFTHHLAPGLAWYQQWSLHRALGREILTESQRRYFGFAPGLFATDYLRLARAQLRTTQRSEPT